MKKAKINSVFQVKMYDSQNTMNPNVLVFRTNKGAKRFIKEIVPQNIRAEIVETEISE